MKAKILKEKLNFKKINNKDIVHQGKLAYRKHNQIISKGKFNFRKVQKRLMPIFNWYSENYSECNKHQRKLNISYYHYNKKISCNFNQTCIMTRFI